MTEENKKMSEEMTPDQPEKPSDKNSMPWLGGVVIILVGVIFLMRQVSGFRLDNWWALFILVPAIGSLSSAWRAYENAERKFTAAVRGSLFGGLMMVLVAAIFLFNLNWSLFFPGVLILAGIGLLVGSLMRS